MKIPERVAALSRNPARQRVAELLLPDLLGAILIAPGPKPARTVMQLMLVGIPHGAVHLMRKLSHHTHSLTNPGFGSSNLFKHTI